MLTRDACNWRCMHMKSGASGIYVPATIMGSLTYTTEPAMNMAPFAFGTTDWSAVETTEHAGETGTAIWRTRYFGDASNRIRVRMVDYTAGYLADHWCRKGHILFCLEGELETTLEDGRRFVLTPGMSYQVGDDAEAHQSCTKTGARLFIVD